MLFWLLLNLCISSSEIERLNEHIRDLESQVKVLEQDKLNLEYDDFQNEKHILDLRSENQRLRDDSKHLEVTQQHNQAMLEAAMEKTVSLQRAIQVEKDRAAASNWESQNTLLRTMEEVESLQREKEELQRARDEARLAANEASVALKEEKDNVGASNLKAQEATKKAKEEIRSLKREKEEAQIKMDEMFARTLDAENNTPTTGTSRSSSSSSSEPVGVDSREGPVPTPTAFTVCGVCLDRPADHVYNPCGHDTCRVCFERGQSRQCPHCRTNHQGIIQIRRGTDQATTEEEQPMVSSQKGKGKGKGKSQYLFPFEQNSQWIANQQSMMYMQNMMLFHKGMGKGQWWWQGYPA